MSTDTREMPDALAHATGLRSCGAKMGVPALGGQVTGARLERIQSSPHFDGTRFHNPITTTQAISDPGGLAWMYVAGREERTPRSAFPIQTPPTGSLLPGQGEALRVTWLGHSSVLIEVDGHLILTDPVFGPRAAPVSWMGPKRFHAAPVPVERLPPLDAVILSHDHYDHLDYPTIAKLIGRNTRFITSLGVGAHLESWGVPARNITELDWWEAAEVGEVSVTATPSRHFAGRGPGTATQTFWSSWAIQGPKSSVWFSGDTGPLEDGFAEIGERFGGFDLTLVESGAWNPHWANIHLGPDNALRTHQLVRGRTMMPIHWGTFSLSTHAWDQPIRRLIELAGPSDVQLLSPMMGETVHRESGVSPFWRARVR